MDEAIVQCILILATVLHSSLRPQHAPKECSLLTVLSQASALMHLHRGNMGCTVPDCVQCFTA